MYFAEMRFASACFVYEIESRTGNIGSLADQCDAESLLICCFEHILREIVLLLYETAG